MSFGYSVGDLLGTARLAYNLWKYWYKIARDAPEGFQHLVSEINTLSQSLRFLEEETCDPNSTLMKAGQDRIRMLNELILHIAVTLNEQEKIAKKYERLRTTLSPSSSGMKQMWVNLYGQ